MSSRAWLGEGAGGSLRVRSGRGFVGEWVEGGGRGVPPALGAQLERRGLHPSLCWVVTPPPGSLPSAFCWAFFTQIHPPASWGWIRGNISPLPYPQSSRPMPEGSPSAAGRARHELGCLAHHKHCPKKPPKLLCAPGQPSTSTQPIPQPWGWAWAGRGGYTGTAPVSGLEAHWDLLGLPAPSCFSPGFILSQVPAFGR